MAAQPVTIPACGETLLSSSLSSGPPPMPRGATMPPGSDTDDGGAVQFDLTPSPEKRDTWMNGTRAASAKRASPSPQPTSQRARAASGSRATSRGRRAGAKEVWPDPDAAVHQRVAVDPHAVTADDCVRQLEADRAHMLEPKRAIESMHARLVVQEEKDLVQDKISEDQKVINSTVTKEAAKLKGDCNTLQGAPGPISRT